MFKKLADAFEIVKRSDICMDYRYDVHVAVQYSPEPCYGPTHETDETMNHDETNANLIF
jgi:hypothetical protein